MFFFTPRKLPFRAPYAQGVWTLRFFSSATVVVVFFIVHVSRSIVGGDGPTIMIHDLCGQFPLIQCAYITGLCFFTMCCAV